MSGSSRRCHWIHGVSGRPKDLPALPDPCREQRRGAKKDCPVPAMRLRHGHGQLRPTRVGRKFCWSEEGVCGVWPREWSHSPSNYDGRSRTSRPLCEVPASWNTSLYPDLRLSFATSRTRSAEDRPLELCRLRFSVFATPACVSHWSLVEQEPINAFDSAASFASTGRSGWHPARHLAWQLRHVSMPGS